jgi:hypothetical protein
MHAEEIKICWQGRKSFYDKSLLERPWKAVKY